MVLGYKPDIYCRETFTDPVNADGVSLQGMAGARPGVAHLEALPLSFSNDLNDFGAVDKRVAFLTGREAGRAKRKGRNHYKEHFVQITAREK